MNQGIWLHSSNRETSDFYRRHGFNAIAEVLLGDQNPTWRQAPIVVEIVSTTFTYYLTYTYSARWYVSPEDSDRTVTAANMSSWWCFKTEESEVVLAQDSEVLFCVTVVNTSNVMFFPFSASWNDINVKGISDCSKRLWWSLTKSSMLISCPSTHSRSTSSRI